MSKYYYSFRDSADTYSIYLSQKVLFGWLKLVAALLAIIFWRRIYNLIYNFIFYKNKTFTDNEELIKFIDSVHPNFKNAYSIKYKKSDRLIEQEEFEAELKATNYQHLISKDTVKEKVEQLFYQYYRDKANKNIKSIKEYTLKPFSFEQDNFDFIFDCNLSKIIPLQFEIREELKRFVVQINGKLINFKLSKKGYVESGHSTARAFTEYWDIALDVNNKCYLVTIYSTKNINSTT